MKRNHLLHFLLVALLIVTFVAVFAISASAVTPAETDVFEVLNASGEHVAYAETLDAAKTSMAAGYTLKVLKDATVDLALDLDYAYNLDATGVTVTGVVAQSAGTVIVKGGTFTTSGETALWTMTGTNTNLTVEDATFTNTNAGNTTADSTVGAVFVFNQLVGNVNVQKGKLTANGTLFYWKLLKVSDTSTPIKVNLTVGADVNGTSKKFGIYVQWNCGGDITFNGGTWVAGRIAHICGGRSAKSTGTLTYNGGKYHSMYLASGQNDAYKAKCLVQNANDFGGLYVNGYGLTVTGGEFTFDGPGVAFVSAIGAIKISGGTFKTTQTGTSVTDKQEMLYLGSAANKGNSISNATFESYASTSHAKDNASRGVVWIDVSAYIVFGEGTKVIAHGNATTIHLSGAPDKTVIFMDGTYTSETGWVYLDSSANPLSTAATGGIYFNGGTFQSGRYLDTDGNNNAGIVVFQSGAYYEINGATFINTEKTNRNNVIFRVMKCSALVVKKGTFTGGTFMRIRGDGATADKSALIIIDPEKDDDVKFEYQYSQTMFWFEGDVVAPTLIIKGGIFSRSQQGNIFTANNGCYGNLYILGGQFTATDASIFTIWTHNNFNLYILGGNFIAGTDFINHSPTAKSKGAESQVTINIYGKGETVNLNFPTFNDYGNRAIKEAKLTSGTAVSTGVYAEGRIILCNNYGYTSSKNVLNIYGGTFVIRNGGAYNIINFATNSVFAINIYGGTFRNLGGTSRFIKSEGGKNEVNFYGGTFSSENTACQDFIAFNGTTVCYDTVTFYGAGEYNGVTTEGVKITHVGRKGSNSALLLTCDGANNQITVVVKGGTFRYTSAEGCSNTFFSWNNKTDLVIEGGTFIGETTFSRNYGNSNIIVKNATISMTSGPKSLFLDYQDVTGKTTLDLANTTTGTFTFYRGTKYEITGEWTSFASAGSETNNEKFDTANTDGSVNNFLVSTIEDAYKFIEANTPTIVLLGDVLLNTTLKVTQNLIIDAKGFAIHATCNPFEVAEGVTLTIVNAVIEDDDMFVFTAGNIVLKNCTLKLFGTKQMITLDGNANLTLNSCTLISPAFTTKSGDADLYNGTYIYLADTFTGKLTINGGSVTEGMKLVYADGVLTPGTGAKGDVVVNGMAFANRQYVVYSRYRSETNYTFTDCTAKGGLVRVFHVCGSTADAGNTGGTYILEGGNYTVDTNLIYLGVYRYSKLKMNNVTAVGNGTEYLLNLHDVATLDINGGNYTQNGNGGVLFFKGYGDVTKDTRMKGIIKGATMISHGYGDGYNKSTVWITCVADVTISDSTVKALNKADGNYAFSGAYALVVDGGANVTIGSGEYVSYGGYAVGNGTGNANNKLTINGGTFEARYPQKNGSGTLVAREIVYNGGGTLIINGGTFEVKTPVEGENTQCGYCVKATGGNVTITGGSFTQMNDVDAVISAEGSATVTIKGGYFATMGMCVARALGGKTGSETNGVVTTASGTTLNITGGVLVLLAGGRSANYVGVIRAGGGTTYGTVNITGGTFINQRGDEENATVIFKNNAASSMSITGGTFLIAAPTKAGVKSFFYRSNGYIDSTGSVANKPTCNITVFGEALSKTDNAEATTVPHATAYYGSGMYYVTGKIAGYADILLDGAQARLRTEEGGVSGIRFVSNFPAELVKELEAKADVIGKSVEYGTIITATKNVLQTGAPFTFTLKALDDAGIKRVNIPAKNGLTVNEDGSVTVRAALVNILKDNYTLSFTAISYAKVGDDYYYSNYDFAANSRSIAEVAEKALADTTGTLPCYDETGALTGESTSRYTKEQQKLLYGYLGKTWTTVIE